MGLPTQTVTITTEKRGDAWNKVTPIDGLPRGLPYPKIMRETEKHTNIIFALSDFLGIILQDTVYPRGYRTKLNMNKCYDYDGLILDEWLHIITENCNMTDTPHFNKYDTAEERMLILKGIKHKDGTAWVTRLEHESYKLFHEYHNN